MKKKSDFKFALFFLLLGIFYFLVFGYDIENDRDFWTWVWLLTSIISFIGAVRFFIASDRNQDK